MGLFQSIFGKEKQQQLAAEQYFKTFTSYSPTFTSWSGALYESELVRSAIDARARHIAKLKVGFQGSAQPGLQKKMRAKPNDFQTWSQFLYRLSTILDMQNTAFILPVLDYYGTMKGYYPVLPSRCELVESKGNLYIRYHFQTGECGAVEYEKCGIITKFQYEDDFFGENNVIALRSTMELINMQNQGISEAVKSSASFRFYGTLTNFKTEDDLAAEQKAFSEKNFSSDAGGFLLFPNTYKDIHQIDSHPFTVDAEQMKLIQTNVFNYFGVNEDIIQNRAIGDDLDGFFEGAIEPFAIQLSEVMTSMTFSRDEQARGNRVYVNANRLQYMNTAAKTTLIKELGDRGFISINEARELLNYEPIEGGDKLPIRGEYYFVGDEKEEEPKEEPKEPTEEPKEGGDDASEGQS